MQRKRETVRTELAQVHEHRRRRKAPEEDVDSVDRNARAVAAIDRHFENPARSLLD